MQDGYWVPRTLDDPAMFLIFRADTVASFFVAFMLAVPFTFIGALLLGIVAARGYVQLRENGDKGLLIQFLYWYTPSEAWLSKFWPSSTREYCGR